jgi:hypothetical protein
VSNSSWRFESSLRHKERPPLRRGFSHVRVLVGSKGIGVAPEASAVTGLVGQGHFLGLDCFAAEAGNTPFAALGICALDD